MLYILKTGVSKLWI